MDINFVLIYWAENTLKKGNWALKKTHSVVLTLVHPKPFLTASS